MSAVNTVTIRKMQNQDLLHVVEILKYWNMHPRTKTDEIPDPETTGFGTEALVFAAVHNQRIVGVAGYILHGAKRAETVSLAVDPAWRGTGLGERLQRVRLDEIKSIGIREVFTESDRPEVVAWYQRKFGYRVTGTRRKKHECSLRDVDHWTVLELDLDGWRLSAPGKG